MGGETWLLINMSGDTFLTQQCRRIIASLLAVHHGWLPADFFRTAVRSDVVVRTPIAPGHLLYLDHCQYHTWNRLHGGLFDRTWKDRVHENSSGLVTKLPEFQDFGGDAEGSTIAWRKRLQTHIELAEGVGGSGGRSDGAGFAEWMREMRLSVCPEIRTDLEVIASLDAFAEGRWVAPMALPSAAPCPEAYRKVLQLLQGLVDGGRWPPTSPARSQVVRAGDGGTFSAVNPLLLSGTKNRRAAEFPELTAAVFELEMAIAPQGRSPSTFAAFNHNALFSPHTDSGAGLGQSSSLIVGLGDYCGGELVVEGTSSDIRYRPLEFDGWRQRHWTLPFAGTRFSLVWFSPA